LTTITNPVVSPSPPKFSIETTDKTPPQFTTKLSDKPHIIKAGSPYKTKKRVKSITIKNPQSSRKASDDLAGAAIHKATVITNDESTYVDTITYPNNVTRPIITNPDRTARQTADRALLRPTTVRYCSIEGILGASAEVINAKCTGVDA